MTLIGHRFPDHPVRAGSRWQARGGRVVTIERIDGRMVYYTWREPDGKRGLCAKPLHHFQCRFSPVAERERSA